jgi:hypothetical protein
VSAKHDDDFEQEGQDEFLAGDVQAHSEVTCPYCGETVSIELDVGGGSSQDYVQDCAVCCQPWRVQVEYDEDGLAHVTVEEAE